MIVGMDFGTTNSGAALFDGKRVSLFPLDPANKNPNICRTAIYMTRTGEYFLGSPAVHTFFEQNVGRPTRYRKVWIGEIVQVFAELPYFYRDVYVYEDEFSPGRLFTSIKSALRNRDYYGTAFQGTWYSPSDLVAVFLIGMKMRLEQHLQSPVTEIVLGRPVHFSEDPVEDGIAQSRLLDAAFKAGFEKVYLEYEPIAAALAYARNLNDREVVLVFDFGGGTLDFTIMQTGGINKPEVIATGGIPVAGDVFDQRLFRSIIPKHLGEGDYFVQGGTRFPIPNYIFEAITQPHEILTLNAPHNLEMLRGIHQGAKNKEKTRALLKVVSSNYALLIYDLVERAKTRLSTQIETSLQLKAPEITIHDRITRADFERAISAEYETIRRELLATLDRAGLDPEEVDRVIRTGGSSQIPLFVDMLNHLFSPEKVRAIDVFSSVTSGLAIRGHQIEAGLASLPAYTPGSSMRSKEGASQKAQDREARQVDLGVVHKYLRIQQQVSQGNANLPTSAWLLLHEGQLRALPGEDVDAATGSVSTGINLSALEPYLIPDSKVLLASLDDQVLLATDQFKLFLAHVRDLYLAQQASDRDVNYALPVENDENLTALALWHENDDSVCMVTSTGHGRAFDVRLLADQITKKPYFLLERRYTGVPLLFIPAKADDLVVVGTDAGRVSRAPVDQINLAAYEIIRTRRGEMVTAARAVPPEQDLSVLAIGASGAVVPFQPGKIAGSGPPASRGMSLKRNFPIVAILPHVEEGEVTVPVLTNRGRLLKLHWPERKNANSSTQLQAGEYVITCLPHKQAQSVFNKGSFQWGEGRQNA